jgi:hypothetical protein
MIPPSDLDIRESVCFSKMLVPTHQAMARCLTPEVLSENNQQVLMKFGIGYLAKKSCLNNFMLVYTSLLCCT